MNLDRPFRYYQADADQAIYNELLTENKCGIRMTCGCGKSLIMRNAKINHGKLLIVYVFPSLSLIEQFTSDYLFDKPRGVVLKVSSEQESTTDSFLIQAFLNHHLEQKIICVTYQSYETLLNCLAISQTTIDVAHFDESHAVCGQTYQKLIFDNDSNSVQCDKSIFYTATPKNANGIVMRDRLNPENNACGKWVYDYSYLTGMLEGYLNPFDIRIDMFMQNTNRSLYESIARAIIISGNSRCLTFHADVATERDTSVNNFVDELDFIATFRHVLNTEFPDKPKNLFKKVRMIALTADTPIKCSACKNAGIKGKCFKKNCCRFNILNNLDACPDNEVVVLSSCQTIAEGVDTKNANMCVFVDPKSSHVKIIQNIGRIVRKMFGVDKPNSTILIPCWVDRNNYLEADGSQEKRDEIIRRDMNLGGNFNGILNVMSALKQEDEELYDICLNYPKSYSPVEINHNLEIQGYTMLDPVGDGSLAENLEFVSDTDFDYDLFNECETDEQTLMEFAEENDVCVEVHSDSLETPIETYNPSSFENSLETVRLFKTTDENDEVVYQPIVQKNGTKKDKMELKPPAEKKQRMHVDVHTNDDVKVFWNIVGDIDLTNDICSCVIDCEVVQYDPMKVAEGIVARAELRQNQGGKLLPREMNKKNRTTPELEQEYKDACKLGNWKQALKHFNITKCPDEVCGYLDANLNGWKNDLDENAMTFARDIVARALIRKNQGGKLLPRLIKTKDQITSKLKQESKDACKLHSLKQALNGQGTTLCSNAVRDYLDTNLVGWRTEVDLDENAMTFARDIVARALVRKNQGGKLLPKNIYNKKNRTTPELKQETRDYQKLGGWKQALNGLNNQNCSDDVRDYLDTNLVGWRTDLDENAMTFAQDIVDRALIRKNQGGKLLPRRIKTKNQTTSKLKQESKDACKLGGWKQALKGLGHSLCSDEVRNYLDTNLVGWRTEVDLDENAMTFAQEIVARANLRESQGSRLLPREMNKKNRTTPELEQEYKDASKLSNWKCALKGLGKSLCSDAVCEYLDENLPNWRDETKPTKSMALPAQKKPKEKVETQTEKKQRVKSEISILHQRYKTMTSANLQAEFQAYPDLWHKYHAISESNESSFPEDDIPRNIVIQLLTKLKTKRTKSIVDLGCGTAQIAHHFCGDPRYQFINYDHVAINDSVIVADISALPLEDDSMDIAVLCLAMWGSNCKDYVSEANRVLETRGCLYIVEPTKRWSEKSDDGNMIVGQEGNKLRSVLTEAGFKVMEQTVNKFSVFVCVKKG